MQTKVITASSELINGAIIPIDGGARWVST